MCVFIDNENSNEKNVKNISSEALPIPASTGVLYNGNHVAPCNSITAPVGDIPSTSSVTKNSGDTTTYVGYVPPST